MVSPYEPHVRGLIERLNPGLTPDIDWNLTRRYVSEQDLYQRLAESIRLLNFWSAYKRKSVALDDPNVILLWHANTFVQQAEQFRQGEESTHDGGYDLAANARGQAEVYGHEARVESFVSDLRERGTGEYKVLWAIKYGFSLVLLYLNEGLPEETERYGAKRSIVNYVGELMDWLYRLLTVRETYDRFLENPHRAAVFSPWAGSVE